MKQAVLFLVNAWAKYNVSISSISAHLIGSAELDKDNCSSLTILMIENTRLVAYSCHTEVCGIHLPFLARSLKVPASREKIIKINCTRPIKETRLTAAESS